MALQFEMLGSGSTGNCGLLRSSETCILIDAGLSCKKTTHLLADRGITPENINAVFITHEHGDHVQGLRGLRKYDHIQFFANNSTASVIEDRFGFGIDWHKFLTGEQLRFNNLNIASFSVPHDAIDPIGYVFSVDSTTDGSIKSVAWMTDLGYIPSHIEKYVTTVDLLIIESNYDNDLLTMDTKRPPYIKARIRGRYGHLPNEAAMNFIYNNKSSNWKKVILAHISADCNNESIIRKLLNKIGNLNFEVDIALP